MRNVDDAWKWYVTTRTQLRLFGRLGRKHWDGLPWDGSLGRDDKLKDIDSEAVVDGPACNMALLTDSAEFRPHL